MRTRVDGAVLAVVVASFVVVGPGVFGRGVDLPDDVLWFSAPIWAFLRSCWEQGISPFWVEGRAGGQSLFADVVPMGPFYPAVALTLVLPTPVALGVAAAAHALLAAFSLHRLAAVFGVTGRFRHLPALAIVSGPLGQWFALDAHHESWATWAWWPLALAQLELSSKRDGRARLVHGMAAAAALSLAISGSHLRIAGAAVGATLVWGILRGPRRTDALGVVVAALALAAPTWVPSLHEVRLAGAGFDSRALLGPPDLALGASQIGGFIAAAPWGTHPDLGLGTVLGFALLVSFGSTRRPAGVTRLLAFGALLLIAGTDLGPLHPLLAPLHVVTAPVDLVWAALALVPLSVGAAAVLEHLLGLSPLERKAAVRLVVVPLIALFVAGGLRAAVGTEDLRSAEHRQAAAAVLVVAGLTAAGVLRSLNTPDPRRWFRLAVVEAIALGLWAHLAIPSAPIEDPRDSRSAAHGDGQLDALDLAAGYDPSLTARSGARTDDEVQDPFADAPRLQDALQDRTFAPAHAVAAARPGLGARTKLPTPASAALLRPLADALSGLEHSPSAAAALFLGPESLGQRTAARFGLSTTHVDGVQWFPTERPVPPCRVIRSIREERSLADRVAATLAGGPPFDVGVADWAPDGPLGAARLGPCVLGQGWGQVRVEAAGQAVLALPLRPHPGWRVRIDGARVDPRIIDVIDTAVVVPAGVHVVEWTFVPTWLPASVVVAGVLALGFLVALIVRGVAGGGTARRALAIAVLFSALSGALPSSALAARVVVDVPTVVDGVRREVLVSDHWNPYAATARTQRFQWSPPAVAFDAPVEGVHIFIEERLSGAEPALRRIAAPGERRTVVQARPTPREGIEALRFGRGQADPWTRASAVTALLALVLIALRRRLRGEGTAALKDPPRVLGLEPFLVAIVVVLSLPIPLGWLLREPFDLEEWTYAIPASVPPEGGPPTWVAWSHAPLAHVLHATLAPLGPGWARVPSLLSALWAVVGLWALLRRQSRRFALASAAAFGVAPVTTYYARSATPYAIVGAAVVWSAHLALRVLEGDRRAPLRLVASLAFAWALHPLALAAVGPLVLFVVAKAYTLGPGPAQRGARELLLYTLMALPVVALDAAVQSRWFPLSAVDALLLAEAYPVDPGPLAALLSFGTVLLGATNLHPWAAYAAVPLVVLGYRTIGRDHASLAHLLLWLAACSIGATAVLHTRMAQDLDGHIFWGYRWVAWGAPFLLALGAASLRDKHAPPAFSSFWHEVDHWLRWGCALLWLWAASRASLDAADSPHPAYDRAAERILADLGPADGLIVLPVWAQREALVGELLRAGATEGQGALRSGGGALLVEAQGDARPLPLDADRAAVARWWVAVASERSFGTEKFRSASSDEALRWFDATFILDARFELPGLDLRRYRRRASPPTPMQLSDPWSAPASFPFIRPGSEPCDGPPDDRRWRIALRLPEGTQPTAVDGGLLQPEPEGGPGDVLLVGGPCSGPPPRLDLKLATPPTPASAPPPLVSAPPPAPPAIR